MAFDVDQDEARDALNEAWSQIPTNGKPPKPMQDLIEKVLNATDVTYKYILVTGFLAKYVNKAVHARALQKGSPLPGAYDARSLCHGVVVRFEKTKGNLFGLSNEPFVNKPARHPEHDKANTQLRNTVIATATHDALEEAQKRSRGDVFAGLVHILRIGSQIAAKEKQVEVATRANRETVCSFVTEFLKQADGGARLVAIWGAFTTLLSPEDDIRVYSPNAPDKFSKTVGDVEVRVEKKIVTATECKQRPLNLDDVKHGIKKAADNGVPEYLFVISEGVVREDRDDIHKTLKSAKGIDLYLIDIHENCERYATMLNPARRAAFGLEVVRLLREMRKFDSANAAADLWNKLTKD